MSYSKRLEREIKELRDVYYKPEANRQFEVGQEVRVGGMYECVVVEVLDEGKIILIQKPHAEIVAMPWYSVYPVVNTEESLIQNADLRINYLQTCIESALNRIYSDGVDFEVYYQRDYCWSLEDKVNLIDSIFNQVDIGKIVLVERDVMTPLEVLDGKHRLSTIKEFYEDKLLYKGKKFSELSRKDQRYFQQYHLPMAILNTDDDEYILRQFIRLNTSGKSMTNQEIDTVKNLLSSLNKKED